MKAGKRGQRTWLIVDGYNMIGAWPILQEKSQRDIEDARDFLKEELLDYCGFTGYELVLVFDAYSSKGRIQIQKPIGEREHQVVYTGQGQTADQFIERFVRDHPKDRMIVASSDQLVQILIFSHAERMSARELLTALTESRQHIRSQIQKARSPKGWMDERLEGSVAEKLEKIRLGEIVYEKPLLRANPPAEEERHEQKPRKKRRRRKRKGRAAGPPGPKRG